MGAFGGGFRVRGLPGICPSSNKHRQGAQLKRTTVSLCGADLLDPCYLLKGDHKP